MLNSDVPLVSIIITSFNRAHYIDRAINSALDQDYPNLEVIVSDNCSSDNTKKMINDLFHDDRLHFYENSTNIGMMPNFLKATKELASGKYITYVSSDDYLINKNFISEAVSRILRHKNIIMVHSVNLSEVVATGKSYIDYSAIYYKNSFYKSDTVPGIEVIRAFPKCHAISFGGSLFNRQMLLSCRPFEDETFSGDTQVILKLLVKGDVSFIDKETYVARKHDGSATFSNASAETYINNLDYINAPYEVFLLDDKFSEIEALLWKEKMYYYASDQIMRQLYVKNREEFVLFVNYLEHSSPQTLREIDKSFGWKLFLFTNKYQLIGHLFSSIRAFLATVKKRIKQIAQFFLPKKII
jgi:glycosyltransferase involved in cell wall biosynthesis